MSDDDGLRPELAEVLRRQSLLQDPARPAAIAKRHALGRRSVRENVADLFDDGSFDEWGGLTVAAQRGRRGLDELITATPADGVVTGIGRVDGRRTAVIGYDATVLAGTQGLAGHKKTDRMLGVIMREQLPLVLFAGNATLFGLCDITIATPEASIGMAGPAMIEGGGLGVVAADDVGPRAVHISNGNVDIAAADDADAVAMAQQALAYFGEAAASWSAPDQRALRDVVPENRRSAYEVRKALEVIADDGTVLELRPRFGRGMVTALARIEGRAIGVIANNPMHLAGAITSDGSDKAARFLQLCDAFDLPVLSLCDTPGMMVGPAAEETALVRHTARMFTVGATLTVPMVTVILRKGYGLGAMAMAGGDFHATLATFAWPTGEVGGMGLEGAVRLAMRKELAAIADDAEREAAYEALVAAAYSRGHALSAATYDEIDDVIDPGQTRTRVASLFGAWQAPPRHGRRRVVDTW